MSELNAALNEFADVLGDDVLEKLAHASRRYNVLISVTISPQDQVGDEDDGTDDSVQR